MQAAGGRLRARAGEMTRVATTLVSVAQSELHESMDDVFTGYEHGIKVTIQLNRYEEHMDSVQVMCASSNFGSLLRSLAALFAKAFCYPATLHAPQAP